MSLIDEDGSARTENRHISVRENWRNKQTTHWLLPINCYFTCFFHRQEIIKHPKFVPSEKKNDIALVRVTKRIWFTDNIRPACLNIELNDENPNVQLIVTGWGLTSTQCKCKFRDNLKTIYVAWCETLSLFFSDFLKYSP